MLALTWSVRVSMTDTVEAPSLLAYTHRPSGVTTRPCGPVGMAMVLVTLLLEVSRTATALSLNRPTYAFGAVMFMSCAPTTLGAATTIPAPSATPASTSPRRILSTESKDRMTSSFQSSREFFRQRSIHPSRQNGLSPPPPAALEPVP